MTMTGYETFTIKTHGIAPYRRRLADMTQQEILAVANYPTTPEKTTRSLYAYQYRRRLDWTDTPPEAA